MDNKTNKIKEWVENLKDKANTIPNLGVNSLAGFMLACDDVIAFIDSLEKEPETESDDFELKRFAKGILDLAKKELKSEHRLSEDTPSSTETEEEREAKIKSTVDYEKGLYDGYEQGKQDALKDLPKWKKSYETKGFEVHVCVIDEDMDPFLDTVVNEGEYYIELSDLKTLPKE